MSNRLPLTVAVLTALCGAYFPYAWMVGKWIEAQPIEEVTPPGVPAVQRIREPGDNARIAREHLADQSWAPDAKIQLRDGDRLFYYSMQWDQTESSDSVRFEPLALVWFTADGPLAVVAESAVVQFQNEFDLAKPNPGRIVGARLEGDVTIRGAGNLFVAGRHFIFSEKSARIWSDNAVAFEYGRHRGESDQGIQIDLKITDTPKAGSLLAIERVMSIHLFRHVQMELAVDERTMDAQSLAAASDEAAMPVHIECDGNFRLDWPAETEAGMAVFEDNVQVHRQFSGNLKDWMRSDTLEVMFAPAAAQGSPPAGGEDAPTRRHSFEPTRLVARGAPVVVHSDQNRLHGTTGFLRYDVAQRVMALSGSEVNPSLLRRASQLEVRPVQMRLAHSDLECQQIGLKMDVQNRVREVVCRGAGSLTSTNEQTKQVELVAQWEDQLRKYPDTQSQLDVIDLTGAAVVKQPKDHRALAANYIKLWMDPLQGASATGPKSPGPSPQPRRMLANDNVTLVSPELHGKTAQLQVWFEDVSLGQRSSGHSRELQPTALRAEKTSMTRLPNQTEPLDVQAGLIRVLVVGRGDSRKPDVAEVWTEGDVIITQQREPNQRPMTLTGDQLHLKNNGDTNQIVDVVGQPARINDAAMQLQGRDIHFDRGRSVVTVDGSGELKLPVERDFEGQPLTEPTHLTITWNEQMWFDGLIARFIGRVNATMLNSSMKCQEMEVHMKNRISFGDDLRSVERDPIGAVVCRYQVEFDSRLIEHSSVQEVRRGRFAAFAIDRSSGVAKARGPGNVSIWRRGQGKRAGLGPLAVAGANQSMRTRDTNWDYTRIDFADEMVGSERLRATTFQGEVQVVYGPVTEPLETLNLDHLPKDAAIMSCDSLQLVQRSANDGKKPIELTANGNAWLEGRSFSAYADTISYDESQGLYMLRSLGDRDAMLSRESRPGAERIPIIAKTFRFIPSRNYVDVDNASLAEGLQ